MAQSRRSMIALHHLAPRPALARALSLKKDVIQIIRWLIFMAYLH
jgi:hypothetical protein